MVCNALHLTELMLGISQSGAHNYTYNKGIHMPNPLPNPADILPHRSPMLYVDELTELTPGVSASGLWTPDKAEFEGHFPDMPILPGVKSVESVAQVGSIAVIAEHTGMVPLFTGSEEVTFQSMIFPGDTVTVEANIRSIDEKTGNVVGDGTTFTERAQASSSVFYFKLVTPEKLRAIVSLQRQA